MKKTHTNKLLRYLYSLRGVVIVHVLCNLFCARKFGSFETLNVIRFLNIFSCIFSRLTQRARSFGRYTRFHYSITVYYMMYI